jgi:hypothetical protein
LAYINIIYDLRYGYDVLAHRGTGLSTYTSHVP